MTFCKYISYIKKVRKHTVLKMETKEFDKYTTPVFYLEDDFVIDYGEDGITTMPAGFWRLYFDGGYFCLFPQHGDKQLLSKDEFCEFVKRCLSY